MPIRNIYPVKVDIDHSSLPTNGSFPYWNGTGFSLRPSVNFTGLYYKANIYGLTQTSVSSPTTITQSGSIYFQPHNTISGDTLTFSSDGIGQIGFSKDAYDDKLLTSTSSNVILSLLSLMDSQISSGVFYQNDIISMTIIQNLSRPGGLTLFTVENPNLVSAGWSYSSNNGAFVLFGGGVQTIGNKGTTNFYWINEEGSVKNDDVLRIIQFDVNSSPRPIFGNGSNDSLITWTTEDDNYYDGFFIEDRFLFDGDYEFNFGKKDMTALESIITVTASGVVGASTNLIVSFDAENHKACFIDYWVRKTSPTYITRAGTVTAVWDDGTVGATFSDNKTPDIGGVTSDIEIQAVYNSSGGPGSHVIDINAEIISGTWDYGIHIRFLKSWT